MNPERRMRKADSFGVKQSVLVGFLIICLFPGGNVIAFTTFESEVQVRVRTPRSFLLAKVLEEGGTVVETREESKSAKPLEEPYPRKEEAHDLPPWLERHTLHDDEFLAEQVERFETQLVRRGFSRRDIQEIGLTMKEASRGSRPIASGMFEFMRLLFQFDKRKSRKQDRFVTKELIMACALHYADCVHVRKSGGYDLIEEAMCNAENFQTLIETPLSENEELEESAGWQPSTDYLDDLEIIVSEGKKELPATNHVEGLEVRQPKEQRSIFIQTDYEEYPEEVSLIAQSAGMVKRAEIMTLKALGIGRIHSDEEAARVRGLFLSVTGDWRGLGIRAIACLYRLEGILKENERFPKLMSPEVEYTSRQALAVFAPLAQRLGMNKLKSRIEDTAFRVLYKRDYQETLRLYRESGASIKGITRMLESQIWQIIQANHDVMDQVESLQVTSRVKEPYSSWKKLLKNRGKSFSPSSLDRQLPRVSSPVLFDVTDLIALRVVLKARKLSDDEPDHATRRREHVLCYMVHHLIRNQWPFLNGGRIKDYIRYPKPNGYQSLHHTAYISSSAGFKWPFEVQVRSEEMHQIAEYGGAAHWDYKLGEKMSSGKNRDPEASHIDSLREEKEELVRTRLFVFFLGPDRSIDSQLLSLPQGARVRDAWEHLLEELVDSQTAPQNLGEIRVLRNGLAADSGDVLCNNDVLLLKYDGGFNSEEDMAELKDGREAGTRSEQDCPEAVVLASE